MSRLRCSQSQIDLPGFTNWLLGRGWERVEPTNEYEVLRMVHPNEVTPLIIYIRPTKFFCYTLWGIGLRQYEAFQNSGKQSPPKPKHSFDPLQV